MGTTLKLARVVAGDAPQPHLQRWLTEFPGAEIVCSARLSVWLLCLLACVVAARDDATQFVVYGTFGECAPGTLRDVCEGEVFGEIFERLRQPAVVGDLLAGVLRGPSLLGFVHPSELTRGLAEMGAIFLLFTVGVETTPRDLMKVGWSTALVAE